MITIASNISASPTVDLGPTAGEISGNEKFADYHALVRSLMWMSVMTRPDIANVIRACARHSHDPTA